MKFESEKDKIDFYKKNSLTIDVAGVPHTFGFGDDVTQTYIMGSDGNNIQSYITCGFVAINNESMKNIRKSDDNIKSLIGFRKQYIVKIDEMLKEE